MEEMKAVYWNLGRKLGYLVGLLDPVDCSQKHAEETVRVSDISKWATCERYALESVQEGRTATVRASAWVGTLAHEYLVARLRDNEFPMSWNDPPARVQWDVVTQGVFGARDQAKELSRKAAERFGAEGLVLHDHEVRRSR